MPQQYPLNHRASFSSATTNNYMPPQPPTNYSPPPPPPPGPMQSQDPSVANNNGNFQRFYGPVEKAKNCLIFFPSSSFLSTRHRCPMSPRHPLQSTRLELLNLSKVMLTIRFFSTVKMKKKKGRRHRFWTFFLCRSKQRRSKCFQHYSSTRSLRSVGPSRRWCTIDSSANRTKIYALFRKFTRQISKTNKSKRFSTSSSSKNFVWLEYRWSIGFWTSTI